MSAEGVRRFRRVPVVQEGVLRARAMGDETRLSVLIRSITCQGVGIASTDVAAVPPAGSPVELTFYVAAEPVTVPGIVVWHGRVDSVRGSMDAGIRFELEQAEPESARTYADWIVDRISHVTRQEQALGALLVRSAKLPLASLQAAIEVGRRSHRELGEVLVSERFVTAPQLERALHHRLTPAPLTPAAELLAWRAGIV